MISGVFIKEGPMNWQVVQQEKGFANITLSGLWDIDNRIESVKPGQERVYVRIMDENTNRMIHPWTLSKSDTLLGTWQCVLEKVPAGGPYRIESCVQFNDEIFDWSTKGDMRHHICVGDIFMIAGQSNGSGYGRDSIYDPPEIGIHMMRENGIWDLASHPMHDCTDTIFPEHLDGAYTGHSPFIAFGRALRKKTRYPVGLILSAKGGSVLASWNPGEAGHFYANMINMIKYQSGKIRGILWFQGEGDGDNMDTALTYKERLMNMIRCSRKDLNNEKLPWFLSQINRFADAATKIDGWGVVREAERQLAIDDENIYVFPTTDCAVSDAIHNSAYANMEIGERLANVVSMAFYGDNCMGAAPDLISAKKDGNKVILTFEPVYGELLVGDNKPFQIRKENGEAINILSSASNENKIILTLDEDVPDNTTVNGVWEGCPTYVPPCDSATKIPILSFFGVSIN